MRFRRHGWRWLRRWMRRRTALGRFGEFMAGLDRAGFAQRRLGLEPHAKQAEVLQSSAKRLLLNCTRQWGTARSPRLRLWFRPKSVVVTTGSRRGSRHDDWCLRWHWRCGGRGAVAWESTGAGLEAAGALAGGTG